MKEEDKFPRFKANAFGDGTGWLFAGALVACTHTIINDIARFAKENGIKDAYPLYLRESIAKLQDTINATMESAYGPTSPPSGNPPKDPNWQKP